MSYHRWIKAFSPRMLFYFFFGLFIIMAYHSLDTWYTSKIECSAEALRDDVDCFLGTLNKVFFFSFLFLETLQDHSVFFPPQTNHMYISERLKSNFSFLRSWDASVRSAMVQWSNIPLWGWELGVGCRINLSHHEMLKSDSWKKHATLVWAAFLFFIQFPLLLLWLLHSSSFSGL